MKIECERCKKEIDSDSLTPLQRARFDVNWCPFCNKELFPDVVVCRTCKEKIYSDSLTPLQRVQLKNDRCPFCHKILFLPPPKKAKNITDVPRAVLQEHVFPYYINAPDTPHAVRNIQGTCQDLRKAILNYPKHKAHEETRQRINQYNYSLNYKVILLPNYAEDVVHATRLPNNRFVFLRQGRHRGSHYEERCYNICLSENIHRSRPRRVRSITFRAISLSDEPPVICALHDGRIIVSGFTKSFLLSPKIKIITELQYDKSQINGGIAVVPNNNDLIAVPHPYRIFLFNLRNKERIDCRKYHADQSLNGRTVTALSNHEIIYYAESAFWKLNINTKVTSKVLDDHFAKTLRTDILDLAVLPDGRIVTLRRNGYIEEWNIITGGRQHITTITYMMKITEGYLGIFSNAAPSMLTTHSLSHLDPYSFIKGPPPPFFINNIDGNRALGLLVPHIKKLIIFGRRYPIEHKCKKYNI